MTRLTFLLNVTLLASAQTYTISTYAGSGPAVVVGGAYSGDGGPANLARLNTPRGAALDSRNGDVVIADSDNAVYRLVRNGIITTLRTSLQFRLTGPGTLSGDGILVAASPADDVLYAINMATLQVSVLAGNPPAGLGLTSVIPTPLSIENVTVPMLVGDYVYFGEARGLMRVVISTRTVEVYAGTGGRFDFPTDHPIHGIATDAAGNIYVTRPAAPNRKFIKISPQGVLSYPGGEMWSAPYGLSYDILGNIYIADGLLCKIFRLNASGAIETIAGTGAISFSGDGGPATQATMAGPIGISCSLAGTPCYVSDLLNHRIRRLDLVVNTPIPAISAGGIVNAASYGTGPLAPGEIVTIFGTNLSPGTFGLTLAAGRVATSVGGVRVLFDGVPAPIISLTTGQISVIAPYSLAGRISSNVVVEVNGRGSVGSPVSVAASAPGIFTANASGTGPAAALNDNGTVNSAANPATRGGIVVLYGTGEGQTNPAGVDGSLVGPTLTRPIQTVTATIGGAPADVIYAGGSPGLVSGVLQINLQVPTSVAPGNQPVVVRIGGAQTQANVTISVR